MRTFFIVLGAASVAYGGYLLLERKRCVAGANGSQAAGQNGATAGVVTSGPTDASAASTTPVDNSRSMVEQYDGGKGKFPPVTYIMEMGTDMIQDRNNVYQCPMF